MKVLKELLENTFRQLLQKHELSVKYQKFKIPVIRKIHRNAKKFSCIKLYKKEERKYYESPNMNNVLDNKEFRKAITERCI